MHDVTGKVHWHEPSKTQKAGKGAFGAWKSPYDKFMEEEGIPIFRDIGISDSRELPRKKWARKGGLGTYIQLFGTEGRWGMYVLEVPGAGATNPEKHLYEEMYLVLEGRGSTEVWQDGDTKRHVFEWQKGSLFSIPVNAYHRIVNASSSPAIMIGGTTAPVLMNLINNKDAVFNNPFVFKDRFSGAEDYFKPNDDIEPDPIRGLARRTTNFIPDVMNCELPLDNRRSPGSRRVEPFMAGNQFYLWIGEHQAGRYSKAHGHPSNVVLICLKGKGYTYTWPEEATTQPWVNGKEHLVRRIDYEMGGMISAAPGGARWFHQHFAASGQPLRLTAWYGANMSPGRMPGVAPGEKLIDAGAVDIADGGTAIAYNLEDPHIRDEFQRMLDKEQKKSDMDPKLYTDNYKVDFVGD